MNSPKNIVVYGIEPSEVTRESVIGKYVHLIGHKCKNKRKIHLEKHGVAIKSIELPKKLRGKINTHVRNGKPKDVFWIVLDNNKILPSDQVIIVETTLEDLIKGHEHYTPRPVQHHYPMWPRPNRKDYSDLLSEDFTCDFLFAFFKMRNRDIFLGWERLTSREELFSEVKEYTDGWTEKNIELFDRLYTQFLEKVA